MAQSASITWYTSETGLGTRKSPVLEVLSGLSVLTPPLSFQLPCFSHTLVSLYLWLYKFLLSFLPHTLDYKLLECRNSHSVELWISGSHCRGWGGTYFIFYFLNTKRNV